MATSTAFLPRGRDAGPPTPLLQSTNAFGGDAESSAPHAAYFPGYYPGYTSYQSLDNERAQFDPVLSVSAGNEQGQSTVGFRVSKYSAGEWHHSNYAKYYQAFADRNLSEQNRCEFFVIIIRYKCFPPHVFYRNVTFKKHEK